MCLRVRASVRPFVARVSARADLSELEIIIIILMPVRLQTPLYSGPILSVSDTEEIDWSRAQVIVFACILRHFRSTPIHVVSNLAAASQMGCELDGSSELADRRKCNADCILL